MMAIKIIGIGFDSAIARTVDKVVTACSFIKNWSKPILLRTAADGFKQSAYALRAELRSTGPSECLILKLLVIRLS